MMIYRKQLAEGKDLTGEEIKAEIAAGNIEGYREDKQEPPPGSIYRARHEKTGAELKKHMLEYTATTKLPNEKGELVPVSQITDQDAVMTAFLGEAGVTYWNPQAANMTLYSTMNTSSLKQQPNSSTHRQKTHQTTHTGTSHFGCINPRQHNTSSGTEQRI